MCVDVYMCTVHVYSYVLFTLSLFFLPINMHVAVDRATSSSIGDARDVRNDTTYSTTCTCTYTCKYKYSVHEQSCTYSYMVPYTVHGTCYEELVLSGTMYMYMCTYMYMHILGSGSFPLH